MNLRDRAESLAKAIYPHRMDDSKRIEVEILLSLFAEEIIKQCHKPTASGYVGPYD
jgi:hypothetical protein